MTKSETRRSVKGAALAATLTCAVVAVVFVAAQTSPTPSWKPVDGKLLTRFARDVSATRVHSSCGPSGST